MKPERPALFLPRRTSSRRRSSTFSGAIPSYRASISVCSRRWCARRLLDHAQQDDPWLRGAGGRPQSRGGALRRHQRRAKLLPRDGIAGLFAGLASALDIVGWEFRLDTTQIQGSTVGFIGIAVALLGREHCRRRRTRRPARRRTSDGDSLSQPRSCVLPARSRVESGDHHPGAHRSLRRGRRHRLAGAATTQAETEE